jgi:hypothetical protein
MHLCELRLVLPLSLLLCTLCLGGCPDDSSPSTPRDAHIYPRPDLYPQPEATSHRPVIVNARRPIETPVGRPLVFEVIAADYDAEDQLELSLDHPTAYPKHQLTFVTKEQTQDPGGKSYWRWRWRFSWSPTAAHVGARQIAFEVKDGRYIDVEVYDVHVLAP